jgi:hypothetical protein
MDTRQSAPPKPSFARLLGDRVIAVRPLIRQLGIAKTATGMILASQLLWEHSHRNCEEFTISDPELAERCGLTVDELRGAKADITGADDRGLPPCFTYVTRGFPRRGWWQVDDQVLNELCLPLVQRGPGPEQGSQFGPEPEQEPSVRARARAGKKAGAATVRARAHNGATGANPSRDSSSGQSPHQFGPEPEQSIYLESLEEKENSQRNTSPTPSFGIEPNSPPPAATADPVQEPQQPSKPRKPRAPRLRITAADVEGKVPANAVADYVTWWNEVRTGQCTEQTLKAELGQIQKIAADPAGGIAAAAEQIHAAASALSLGCKGWQAITHKNWLAFGRPKAGASPSSREQRDAELRRITEACGGQNLLHAIGQARQNGQQMALSQIVPVSVEVLQP